MHSFITQPSEVWIGHTWDGFRVGPRFTDKIEKYKFDGTYNTYDSLSVPKETLVAHGESAGSYFTEYLIFEGITRESSCNSYFETEMYNTDYKSSPATILVGTNTETVNYTSNNSATYSGTTRILSIVDDTSSGASGGQSERSGATNRDNIGTGNIVVNNGTPTVYDWPPTTTVSTEANTFVGASTIYYASNETIYYSTRTVTYSGYTVDGEPDVSTYFNAVSTSSWTYTASTSTTTTQAAAPFTATTSTATNLSTWDTTMTSLPVTITTSLQEYDSKWAITYPQDDVTNITEAYGTGGTGDQMFTQTGHDNSPLIDTICLLRAWQGELDVNQGYALWTFTAAVGGATTNAASLGAFTDFFASTSGMTITIPDYRKWRTSSVAEGTITCDTTTVPSVITGTPDTAVTLTFTRSNGHFTTDYTDSTSVMQTVTDSYNFGAVSSFLSTYWTTNDHALPAASTTVYTYTDYISGYATSGALPFTTATSIGQWVTYGDGFYKQSTTHTKWLWASSYLDTFTAWSLAIRTHQVLAESHTVVGAGTNTTRVYLGLVAQTTTSTYYASAIYSSTVWYEAEECLGYTLTVTGETADTDFHNTYSNGNTTNYQEAHNLTRWTFQRMGMRMQTTNYYNLTPGDEIRYTIPAHGYVGFVGSFTQPDPAMYLTTTFGMVTGATFHSSWSMAAPSGEDLLQNTQATIYLVNAANTPSLYGEGLERSSLVSAPTALVTALSVAATWTSTYSTMTGTYTTTSVTSKMATHTIGVVSAITGEFMVAEALTINSGDSNIGINGILAATGGYGGGENRMNASATVYVGMGRVSWTQRTAYQSTGGATGSTSSTCGWVSFTVPGSVGLIIKCEPVVTVSWEPDYTGDHIQSTTPHPANNTYAP